MKIKIENAKSYQLRKFAIEVLGLEMKAGESTTALKARIASVYEGDSFDVEDEDIVSPAQKRKAIDITSDEAPGKVTIIISKTNEPGGSQDVPVAVNGRAMLVPRGKPVEIPEHYFEALKNAEIGIYDELPEGGINPEPRLVPAYPYQRIA